MYMSDCITACIYFRNEVYRVLSGIIINDIFVGIIVSNHFQDAEEKEAVKKKKKQQQKTKKKKKKRKRKGKYNPGKNHGYYD